MLTLLALIVSTADECIYKQVLGFLELSISNEEMNDFMDVVNFLEDSSVLMKRYKNRPN